jgi:hypothetical protein
MSLKLNVDNIADRRFYDGLDNTTSMWVPEK